MSTERVVIIGAGHAAAELIASLKKLAWQGEVVLVGEEALLPYQRPPLSKAYFQGELEQAKLLIKPESAYEQIDTYLQSRAVEVDAQSKTVLLASGEELSYTKLVFATGTRARKLPIPGADANYVYTLRTVDDVDKLRASIPNNGTLLIVGAGYIGLEVAASAVKQGKSVVVLEAQERVLQRVTSPVVSQFYTEQHQTYGVDIRLGVNLDSFKEIDGVRVAVLENGTQIEFDSALVGIGVVPNVELAQSIDLDCDNGIVVDKYCRTTNHDIYAIGDVSNQFSDLYQQNLRLESVPNALEQAKKTASSICQRDFPDNFVPWFWSDQYDLKLQTAGMFNGYDELVVRNSPDNKKMSVFYLKEKRLIACDAINSPAEFMVSKKLILAKAKLDTKLLADKELPLKTFLS